MSTGDLQALVLLGALGHLVQHGHLFSDVLRLFDLLEEEHFLHVQLPKLCPLKIT